MLAKKKRRVEFFFFPSLLPSSQPRPPCSLSLFLAPSSERTKPEASLPPSIDFVSLPSSLSSFLMLQYFCLFSKAETSASTFLPPFLCLFLLLCHFLSGCSHHPSAPSSGCQEEETQKKKCCSHHSTKEEGQSTISHRRICTTAAWQACS